MPAVVTEKVKRFSVRTYRDSRFDMAHYFIDEMLDMMPGADFIEIRVIRYEPEQENLCLSGEPATSTRG